MIKWNSLFESLEYQELVRLASIVEREKRYDAAIKAGKTHQEALEFSGKLQADKAVDVGEIA